MLQERNESLNFSFISKGYEILCFFLVHVFYIYLRAYIKTIIVTKAPFDRNENVIKRPLNNLSSKLKGQISTFKFVK